MGIALAHLCHQLRISLKSSWNDSYMQPNKYKFQPFHEEPKIIFCTGYENDLHRLQYVVTTSRLGVLQKSR